MDEARSVQEAMRLEESSRGRATPTIRLNDNTTIPQLGFGTLNVPPDRTPSPANTAKTAEIVGVALEASYRHIDTAQMYGNEKGVGAAIAASGIPRNKLYVTSKLGNGNHRPDDVRRSFDQTLEKLGLEQLDLFLMHWPLMAWHCPNNRSGAIAEATGRSFARAMARPSPMSALGGFGALP